LHSFEICSNFAPSNDKIYYYEEIVVKQNQHLPEIPSAAEMQEQGVNMNELQMQLLQKVEELTLYIIQQDQRIKELEELLK